MTKVIEFYFIIFLAPFYSFLFGVVLTLVK